MPVRQARGGARSSASTVSRKSSTQTLKSNARSSTSISGRNSSPLTEVPDEGEWTSLRAAITVIFADAQNSTAGHRKLVISLRKIQEACCYEPVSHKKGKRAEDFDEDDFNQEVERCVVRVLAVKKSEPVGDRIVRFLGTYLKVASDRDNEIAEPDPDTTTLPETPTSRLTTRILSTLLKCLTAKDKTIRFRATQITSHIINSLDTLDDQLFHQLKSQLLRRIHDKEAPVRLQAVYGLGRLAAEVEDNEAQDDSDSDNDVGSGVLVKLLDVLQNDPSAEVRRNLLLNLPLTPATLPYLLERARDLDASTRRALYARLLPALGDFRHLSLTHREKLLRWGLRDRDENVRKATARLFRERWIEDCAALPAASSPVEGEDAQAKPNNQAADPSLDALLELLERIDVVNSGVENGIAQVAMRDFWEGRPDYVDYVSFPDTFWEDLSPELAFVARSFNDFCRTSGKEDGYAGPRALDVILEEKLPEVTKFGFLLERELQRLAECVRSAALDGDEEADEDSVQREFVVEQMLHMALTFDYSDEVGRRKMFGLMREALALAELPEEATRLVVEVLRLVCGEDAKGEREFCGVVLEAVAEVHDTIMGDDTTNGADGETSDSVEDSFHSATSQPDDDAPQKGVKKAKKTGEEDVEMSDAIDEEKAIKEIMVNMKCLHIAQCMLQNVQCDLGEKVLTAVEAREDVLLMYDTEENVHLVTMLNNLVVPAVRSQEAPIRERGLVCLGLCCLLGKNLAQQNLALFLTCFAKGHPALQTIALQIIGDILVTHPSLLADAENPDQTETTETENLLKPVLKAFSRSLKSADAAVQSTGATAIAKAMLSRLVTETDLLKQLVVAYFDPDTNSNAHLRQALSYFLPVYCHSRAENAERVVTVSCSVIAKLAAVREAWADEEEDDEGMVKLSVVGQMLLDWTDPRKIVGFAEAAGANTSDGASEVHFLLAEHILERVVTTQTSKEEKKVLFSMLSKLHLPHGGCGGERLRTVLELLAEAVDTRVATDATSRNTLTKLQNSLLKLMHDIATEERGGGGEETILETTELTVRPGAEVGDDTEATTALEEEEEDDATLQLQREMGDATIGAPDAEGTRVQLGEPDSELDVSGLADETAVQSLIDADEDDEDLL